VPKWGASVPFEGAREVLEADAVKELTAGNRSTRESAAAIVRNLAPRSGHVPR
jgi:hypothetical protein